MANALIPIIEKEKYEVWDMKSDCLPKKINVDHYFKRALMSISENKAIMDLTVNEVGARSIFMEIGKALQMGLQIGGHIPQAYLLPFFDKDANAKKATLCPTAEGYKFIALSDPAVLKSFEVRAVYEGENFSIDFANAEISHAYDGTTKRGPLIGVYGKWVDLNDNPGVGFINREQIEHIRKVWSKQPEGTAWVKSFDEMAMSKAAKKFLKPYASLKEGLQMAMAMDESPFANERKTGDISDRANDRLKNVIDTTADPVYIESEKPVKETKEVKKSEKNKNNTADELFS